MYKNIKCNAVILCVICEVFLITISAFGQLQVITTPSFLIYQKASCEGIRYINNTAIKTDRDGSKSFFVQGKNGKWEMVAKPSKKCKACQVFKNGRWSCVSETQAKESDLPAVCLD
jgi:arginine exporter protein ArgO